MTTTASSMNSQVAASQFDVLFATSNKGKPLLIFEQHVFKCNKTTATKKYWVCDERGCGIYIHTSLSDEFLSITGSHNHSSNPDQVEVKFIRDKMKERILTETTSITKIYDEEIAKANLSKGATAIIPTVVEYRMYSWPS